jgi:hypothetical protein
MELEANFVFRNTEGKGELMLKRRKIKDGLKGRSNTGKGEMLKDLK